MLLSVSGTSMTETLIKGNPEACQPQEHFPLTAQTAPCGDHAAGISGSSRHVWEDAWCSLGGWNLGNLVHPEPNLGLSKWAAWGAWAIQASFVTAATTNASRETPGSSAKLGEH